MKREYKSEYRLNSARDYRTDWRRRQLRRGAKWGLYILFLYLGYVFQATPGLLSLWGIKPVWVLAVCVCVATLEGPYAAAWFGLFGGLLWDLSAGRAAGFFTVLVACGCFLTALLFQVYFRASPRNAVLACACASLGLLMLDTVFNYMMYSVSGVGRFFFLRGLPTAAYTALVAAGVFLAARRVHNRLRLEDANPRKTGA